MSTVERLADVRSRARTRAFRRARLGRRRLVLERVEHACDAEPAPTPRRRAPASRSLPPPAGLLRGRTSPSIAMTRSPPNARHMDIAMELPPWPAANRLIETRFDAPGPRVRPFRTSRASRDAGGAGRRAADTPVPRVRVRRRLSPSPPIASAAPIRLANVVLRTGKRSTDRAPSPLPRRRDRPRGSTLSPSARGRGAGRRGAWTRS